MFTQRFHQHRRANPCRSTAQLTIFYPSTEWELASPFTCYCGADDCVGPIAGASRLSAETLARYPFAPHTLALLQARDSRIT